MRAEFEPVPPATIFGRGEARLPPGVAWHPIIEEAIRRLPAGMQRFWGIPFALSDSRADPRWLWLGAATIDSPTRVPLGGRLADWVVFAHFCGASNTHGEEAPEGYVGVPGSHLASYVLVYVDGLEHRVPIRRRFEVNDVLVAWGQRGYGCLPHRSLEARSWQDPHADSEWGLNQQGAKLPSYVGVLQSEPRLQPLGNYWVYALSNPRPDTRIVELRLEATGSEPVAVGGITLVRSRGHPLRHRRLVTLRVAGIDPEADLQVDVDLGIVARKIRVRPESRKRWLASPVKGWGEEPIGAGQGDVVVQVAAAEAATISINGIDIPASELDGRGRTRYESSRVRIMPIPEPERLWSFEIRDAASGSLTPARVHFETRDGLYLPPIGHRQEVNDRWFEDYGADVKLGRTQFAYVPGKFQIRLPPSPVLAEVVRGFEYEPVRIGVDGSRPPDGSAIVTMNRLPAWNDREWLSADTHVHFLSPETAWLEGRAEDLNIVNLLASQWGDLYTNVGDYTGSMSGVSRDDTLVWVGTENRQHMLGHISLLGMHGEIPAPLCAAGPNESYFGDPTWTSLSDWAEAAHTRGGLVVVPHFPNPQSEVVADVVLKRVDALEVRDFWTDIDTPAVREWYRLLNCGYRVPIVGGTDKMTAGMPIGGVRTYAQIGDAGVSWDAWSQAVKSGRTFSSSGPLLQLSVDGRGLGDEIRVGPGGGTVEVQAAAMCSVPIHRLEIIHNGAVVASREAGGGSGHLRLSERVRVGGTGWIAARCVSRHVARHQWPVRFAAHTSPIYLVGDPAPVRADDVAFLQTVLEGGLTWLGDLATRADPKTHARVSEVFRSAIKALEDVGRHPRPSR